MWCVVWCLGEQSPSPFYVIPSPRLLPSLLTSPSLPSPQVELFHLAIEQSEASAIFLLQIDPTLAQEKDTQTGALPLFRFLSFRHCDEFSRHGLFKALYEAYPEAATLPAPVSFPFLPFLLPVPLSLSLCLARRSLAVPVTPLPLSHTHTVSHPHPLHPPGRFRSTLPLIHRRVWFRQYRPSSI